MIASEPIGVQKADDIREGDIITGDIVGISFVQESDMVCDDADSQNFFSLRSNIKCDLDIKDTLSASDFKLSYDSCQYKVEVTHAAGCPINSNSRV